MAKTNLPPKEFCERIKIHNRRAVTSAFLCLIGTLVCWGIGWFLFHWFTLFILSTIFGESARNPDWLHYLYIGILAYLYAWALLDAFKNRFPEPQDRIIFGWKEVKDILLGLPRMTFGILGNLRALILLSKPAKIRSWELVHAILTAEEHSTFQSLAIIEPNPRARLNLLNTLQLLGIVDLHPSREEDFFYLVRSNQVDWMKPLFTVSEELEEGEIYEESESEQAED